VIRAVSEQLASVARESDALGRWGGEEFLAILPNTDEAAALVLAERMRAVVEGATIPVASGLHVTISVGAAGVPGPGDPDPARWEAALRMADDAMYRAKAAGRNRVMGPARRG
jgi:diguanylate cyclase (GGDEF)-like protein